MTQIANGHAGGRHITDGPLSTPMINEAAPGLLRNDIDTRVARIRPMATPIDQISRMIGARRAASMIVEYYSVDNKSQTATFSGSATETNEENPDGYMIYTVAFRENGVVAPTDTLMVPSVAATGGCLVLYVTEAVEGNTYKVIALNGATTAGVDRKSVV